MEGSVPRVVINESEAAARVMDGEAIIINLSSGLYYSMGGVGACVWELIEGGHGLDQIAAVVARRYDVDLERAATDVQRLAADLLEQGLVLAAEEGGTQPPDDDPAMRLPYEPPRLHTYRDMGDLLALDPPMPGLDGNAWQEKDGPAANERGS